MKTDKQIYTLLSADPDFLRLTAWTSFNPG
jgi:hypothetical protein